LSGTGLLRTLPAPGAPSSFLVRYADGSSETLTAPVVDLLTSYQPHVMVAPAAMGSPNVPTTPVFSWNVPNPVDLAASNTLDHVTLVIARGSGSSLTTVRTVTITPSTTTAYRWVGTALLNSETYSYQFSAVDAAGDRDSE
jgi:hypothetical protein